MGLGTELFTDISQADTQILPPVDIIYTCARRSLNSCLPRLVSEHTEEIDRLPTIAIAGLAAYARLQNIVTAAIQIDRHPMEFASGASEISPDAIFQQENGKIAQGESIHLVREEAESVIADVQGFVACLDGIVKNYPSLQRLVSQRDDLLRHSVREPIPLYLFARQASQLRNIIRVFAPPEVQRLFDAADRVIEQAWEPPDVPYKPIGNL